MDTFFCKQATKICGRSSSNWNVAKTRARIICFGNVLFTRPAIRLACETFFASHMHTKRQNVCMRIGHYRAILKSKTIERVFLLLWVFFFTFKLSSKNYFRIVRFRNLFKEFIICGIIFYIRKSFFIVFNLVDKYGNRLTQSMKFSQNIS